MPDMFKDALASIGAAISDVREKVVEERWFGRSLSDGQPRAHEPESAAPVAPTKESCCWSGWSKDNSFGLAPFSGYREAGGLLQDPCRAA